MKKRFISMIIIATMILTMTVNAYAAEPKENTGDTNEIVTLSDNDFHKVNGTGTTKGGADTYTSTTTKVCHTIKAMGTILGSPAGGRSMVIHIYYENSNTPIAWGNIQLDGKFHTLSSLNGTNYYPAGTYRVRVEPSFSGGYEVSTYFYL